MVSLCVDIVELHDSDFKPMYQIYVPNLCTKPMCQTYADAAGFRLATPVLSNPTNAAFCWVWITHSTALLHYDDSGAGL